MGYIKIILFFGILSALGGGFAYHKVTVAGLEQEVAQLTANNQTLKENQNQLQIAVDEQKQELENLQAQRDNERAQVAALTNRNNELQKDKERYLRIFRDHNLTRLARAKPDWMQKLVNKGTQDVFRQVENDSKYVMQLDAASDAERVPDDVGDSVETQ